MGLINELWLAGKVPARDGLYRADGTVLGVDIDGPRLSAFRIGEPFDVAALLAGEPGLATSVDPHPAGTAELPDGTGYVCCGDGTHCSEGFFARLDSDGNLVWVVALGQSKPFVRAEARGTHATFTNSLGHALTVDLTAPAFATR
ncbi:hypothetical protein ACIP98_02875 [Streptomyces sp. NPDC088354]|uniref:hypothetical protein n=1 Tax=unclassified Streptomyces TaxID=2593676 RepID=UPI0029B862D5|nr:hypothetical protein [Streptomyces sp. MI02-7b]MDX3076073.1 hypothetical protein [Streptomyces sp. MI02-7b]